MVDSDKDEPRPQREYSPSELLDGVEEILRGKLGDRFPVEAVWKRGMRTGLERLLGSEMKRTTTADFPLIPLEYFDKHKGYVSIAYNEAVIRGEFEEKQVQEGDAEGERNIFLVDTVVICRTDREERNTLGHSELVDELRAKVAAMKQLPEDVQEQAEDAVWEIDTRPARSVFVHYKRVESGGGRKRSESLAKFQISELVDGRVIVEIGPRTGAKKLGERELSSFEVTDPGQIEVCLAFMERMHVLVRGRDR